jgi:hypothetical protein
MVTIQLRQVLRAIPRQISQPTPRQISPYLAISPQVQQAARLASYLNRTLILPRLRCGDSTLAYPCYAW